mmetsp:Transcript_42869/g.132465  ORF Transcript_42869/g.132465 Transcript_42869/m.132465 type:complete len:375 (-) Transcript_42869:76-1200(-)
MLCSASTASASPCCRAHRPSPVTPTTATLACSAASWIDVPAATMRCSTENGSARRSSASTAVISAAASRRARSARAVARKRARSAACHRTLNTTMVAHTHAWMTRSVAIAALLTSYGLVSVGAGRSAYPAAYAAVPKTTSGIACCGKVRTTTSMTKAEAIGQPSTTSMQYCCRSATAAASSRSWFGAVPLPFGTVRALPQMVERSSGVVPQYQIQAVLNTADITIRSLGAPSLRHRETTSPTRAMRHGMVAALRSKPAPVSGLESMPVKAITMWMSGFTAHTTYSTGGTTSRHRNRRISSSRPGSAKSPPQDRFSAGGSIAIVSYSTNGDAVKARTALGIVTYGGEKHQRPDGNKKYFRDDFVTVVWLKCTVFT